MSDLPERAGPRPEAIDVAGVETTPARLPAPHTGHEVASPTAPASPPASPSPGDAAPRVQRPERRHLATDELIEEGTKLVVGSVLLLGRAVRTLIETYAEPSPPPSPVGTAPDPSSPAPPASPAPAPAPSAMPADRAGAAGGEAPAPAPAPEPDTVLAALPTALLGAGLQAQRRMVTSVFDAQQRLGPAVSWWLDRPVVSPAYQRLRGQVFDWYRLGRADAEISRTQALGVLGGGMDEILGYVYENLDLNVITKGFDVGPLIQNLELNDIIMESTGGLATEAIDAVRAQGVMVDDVIERITSKVFRRRATRVPKGPPGRYGPAERFPNRTPST